jgi:hypothetical protein
MPHALDVPFERFQLKAERRLGIGFSSRFELKWGVFEEKFGYVLVIFVSVVIFEAPALLHIRSHELSIRRGVT